MPITITCPSCAARINAPDAAAGKKVKCPKCQHALVVPVPNARPNFEVVEDEPAPAKKPPAPAAKPKPKAAVARDEDEDEAPDERPRTKRAKAAVEDNEDEETRAEDEEEKPKTKRKGDDPDEDEKGTKRRPKKKTKTKKPAGAPWLLIGGGAVLLVAAVVGVLAATGAFSKKPPATVNNPEPKDAPPDSGPPPKAIPTVRQPRATLTAENNRRVGALAVSPDGKMIATATWEVVRLWDVDPPKERVTLPATKGMIHNVMFSPDSKTVAAVDYEGIVHLWDIETYAERTLKETGMQPRGLAFSPDGKLLAVGGAVQKDVTQPQFGKISTFHSHVVLHDLKTGEERGNWTGEKGGNGPIAFLKGGTVLAVTEDEGVVLRAAMTGQAQTTIKGRELGLRGLAASADGKLLAISGWEPAVRLCDATGQEMSVLNGYPNRIGMLALTPDGALVVAANGDYDLIDKEAKSDEARVWDVGSKQPRAVIAGQRGWMGAVAVTPNGKMVVTGGADGVIRLWDVPALGSTTGPEPTVSGDSVAASALVQKYGGKAQRQGAEIVSVDLTGTKVTDADLGPLAALKFLQKVRLDRTEVTDAGLERLHGLSQLEELGVVGTAVTETAAAAFHKAVPGCRVVWSADDFVNGLINNRYDLAAAMRSCGGRVQPDANGNLVEVIFARTGQKITDEALKYLKAFPKLKVIALDGDPKAYCDVTDAGLAHLKDMTGLENLSIGWTRVTDGGLVHLAGLTELKYLNLRGLAVTDAGLESLKGLKKLEAVYAAGSKITPTGAAALHKSLLGCNVLLK